MYKANKGDQLLTFPAVKMHLEPFNLDHDLFDIDRKHANAHAFGDGPHHCPGQITALKWLQSLTNKCNCS